MKKLLTTLLILTTTLIHSQTTITKIIGYQIDTYNYSRPTDSIYIRCEVQNIEGNDTIIYDKGIYIEKGDLIEYISYINNIIEEKSGQDTLKELNYQNITINGITYNRFYGIDTHDNSYFYKFPTQFDPEQNDSIRAFEDTLKIKFLSEL